jgi:hypothetical protein
VQLVTDVFRVEVQRLQYVRVLELVAVELVGVIGDQDLLLADDGPVVALRAAVIEVELVRGPA